MKPGDYEEMGDARRAISKENKAYNFALVPKRSCSRDYPFFYSVLDGCQEQASRWDNVVCECIDTTTFPLHQQELADVITNLTLRGDYDGLALAVDKRTEALNNAISNAVDAGIAFLTFDNDAPDSKRQVYIGTDNVAMGRTLAKVLLQINPEGGKYAFVSEMSPNSIEREKQTRVALLDSVWSELGDGLSPILGTGNGADAVDRMFELAEAHPDLTAIVSLYRNQMLEANWKDFSNKYHERITLVNTGSSKFEIDLLRKGYTDALVGELPYDMGKDIVKTLLKLQQEESAIESEMLGTNMLEMMRTSSALPPVNMNYNYIGSYVVIGYVCFGIVVALSTGFAVWTFVNRESRVVRASQPIFLNMLCIGVLIFASTIIPLGIDDERYSLDSCNIACMSVPWLFSMGFAFIFSILFSKTWRINQIFHNPNKYTRLKVTPRDVALPMVILMTINAIILTCWTVIGPAKFVREPDGLTDPWNRSISSMGLCERTENPVFNILSAFVMIGTLVMANVQAYKARDIETEFSESHYIALLLVSVLQASLVCMPLNFLQGNNALARYIILTLYIFLVSVAVMLLIFVPKYKHHREWLLKREEKRRNKEARCRAGIISSMSSQSPENGPSGLKIVMKQSVMVNPISISSQSHEEASQGKP